MNGVSGCVPLRFSMPALLLFIGDYDSSLTKAAICFAFTFLEKYENPAVLVRNVGFYFKELLNRYVTSHYSQVSLKYNRLTFVSKPSLE